MRFFMKNIILHLNGIQFKLTIFTAKYKKKQVTYYL